MCRLYTYFKYHTGKSRQAWKKSLLLSPIQDKTWLGNLKYCLSCSSPEVESFPSIFCQFMKGILLYLHAGGKDRMKLYKKDQFLISPHLLHPRIFKWNPGFHEMCRDRWGFLTILCRINIFACLINLSFQWIQRGEKEKEEKGEKEKEKRKREIKEKGEKLKG